MWFSGTQTRSLAAQRKILVQLNVKHFVIDYAVRLWV